MERVLLMLLAAVVPAKEGNVPPPPVLEAVPSPDSDEAQQQLAAEQSVALARATRARRNVARTFAVGWEMHHGLFLVPAQAKNWIAAEWVMPDFLDGKLRDLVATTAAGGPNTAAHVGQKLLCRCTGIEWSFYGQKRFLIRQADLTWK